MDSQPTALLAQTRQPSSLLAIIVGGGIAGFNDLIFAFVLYGWKGADMTTNWKWIVTTAPRICRTIAAGLIGSDAYRGESAAVFLGVVLHFAIALIWASIFYATSRFIPFLKRQAVLCGLFFGVVVWLGMNAVVVPLSAIHAKFQPALSDWKVWIAIAGQMVLIGLPIALAVRRWAR